MSDTEAPSEGLRPPESTPDGAIFVLEQKTYPLDIRIWTGDGWATESSRTSSPLPADEWRIIGRLLEPEDAARHDARVNELLQATSARDTLIANLKAQRDQADADKQAVFPLIRQLRQEKQDAVMQGSRRSRFLEARVTRMTKALLECRRVFLLYADMHLTKNTEDGAEKALRNTNLAIMCRDALQEEGA